MIKVYAEAVRVGNSPRARGRQGESQRDLYLRSGYAFGRRITSVNGRGVSRANATTNR